MTETVKDLDLRASCLSRYSSTVVTNSATEIVAGEQLSLSPMLVILRLRFLLVTNAMSFHGFKDESMDGSAIAPVFIGPLAAS